MTDNQRKHSERVAILRAEKLTKRNAHNKRSQALNPRFPPKPKKAK